MAEVVKKATFNPESLLKKVVKLKPAGSVKEWLDWLNAEVMKHVKSGKYVYDEQEGKIKFVK